MELEYCLQNMFHCEGSVPLVFIQQSKTHITTCLADIQVIGERSYELNLYSLLEGPAANTISGLSLTSTNYMYTEAMTVLYKRFGNKQQVINKHRNVLLDVRQFHQIWDLKRLCHLYNQVDGHIRSLKSLVMPSELYGNLLAPILLKWQAHDLCVTISRKWDWNPGIWTSKWRMQRQRHENKQV